MTWLSSHYVELAGARVSYASLLVALTVLVVGFALASNVASRVRGSATGLAQGLRWRATIAQVVGYSLRALALAIALQVTGVNIASILAAGAVVAVGIGIAMQKVAENFVSGVILLAERSIREGDIIEFEGRIARVRQMGIRATIAETLDDEEIIVPNSVLAQSSVKNLTLTEPIYRLRVRVGVAYQSDLTQVEATLHEAAEGLSWRARDREPVVLLVDFAGSSVDFEVSVWTLDVWSLRRGQSDLRKAIWHALKAAGISIPFPQLDVRVAKTDPPTELPEAARRGTESSMSTPQDPEQIDLAELARGLRAACGPSVEGAIVGRTMLRDAVLAKLGCSELEAERLVDTMVGRGFLVKDEPSPGLEAWTIVVD